VADVNDLSSHELLARYRRGDDQAATEIFDRYVRRLLELVRQRLLPRLARRLDADDVVQSAYRSFFIHARDGEFVLKRAGDLWRLLSAIALNKLQHQIERHTAARRDMRQEMPAMPPSDAWAGSDVVGVEPSPAAVAAVAEELEDVMRRRSPLERQVVEMRLQGRSVEEIAARISRSQRTVRRLLEAVRQDLETHLAET
jgi:RNA polymerase sigma factor (sigma-70 family)